MVENLYNEHGVLDKSILDVLDTHLYILVKSILEVVPTPALSNGIFMTLLTSCAVSRLTIDLAFQSQIKSLEQGRVISDNVITNGLVTNESITNPLVTMIESDIGRLYEAVENGRYCDNSSHDMVQLFDRMLSNWKRGHLYFSDVDTDE